MTRVEALEAVRAATVDLVAAIEFDALDPDDVEWLDMYQRHVTREAVLYGCEPDTVIATVQSAIGEVTGGHA